MSQQRKRKIRVAFSKNRKNRSRAQELTRDVLRDLEQVEDASTSERISGKSTLRSTGAGMDGQTTAGGAAGVYAGMAGANPAALKSDLALTPQGFGSPHPDGAHMALADGAVRFVNARVDREILRCLGNRHDGEVIPEF